MKNILLIITLLISWIAIAEEKVWYCDPVVHTGLYWEKGHGYKATTFNNIERLTIKQVKDNHLIIRDKRGEEEFKKEECKEKYRKLIIACSDGTSTFALNPKTGYATSSSAGGWILSNRKNPSTNDSVKVIVWKCESF
jgi:hypothetical protein